MARREQGRQLFSPRELLILAVSVVGAVIGVVGLLDRPDRDLTPLRRKGTT